MLRNRRFHYQPGFGSLALMPVIALLLAASTIAAAQMPGQKAPGPPPEQVEQTSHGIRATAGREILEVTVCSDSVIHVVATPEPSAPASPRPWMLDAQQSCPGAPFTFAQDAKAASIKTAQLEVIVNIERGNLTFRTDQWRIAAERRQQHSAHIRAGRAQWRSHLPRYGPLFSFDR